MPTLLEQLKKERASPTKGYVSLLDRLRSEAGRPGEVSSPLLPGPTLTEEQLKTMELEGIPIGGPMAKMPRPAGVPALPFGGFLTEPVTGPAAVPIDIAEAILHLGKGVAALPAVGLESAERLGVALLAGMPTEEALAEAEKAGAWLGPGPATPAMEAIAGVAEVPHKVSVEAVEAMEVPKNADDIFMDFVTGQPKREPLINISPETARKVTLAAKTILGTLIELGMYELIGRGIRKVVPKKKAKLTVEEVEKVAKEMEPEFPSEKEIKAKRLAEKDMKLKKIVPTEEELAELRDIGVADAALERITPKPKVPVERAEKIPAFKSAEEAIDFGTRATPEQVKRMEALRKEHLKKSKELREADKAEEAMPHAQQASVLREGIDASTGDLVRGKLKPAPTPIREVWHGTDIENLGGIITEGLKPGSSVGAQSTGYPIRLLFDKSELGTKEVPHRPGDYITSKSAKPKEIEVNLEDLGRFRSEKAIMNDLERVAIDLEKRGYDLEAARTQELPEVKGLWSELDTSREVFEYQKAKGLVDVEKFSDWKGFDPIEVLNRSKEIARRHNLPLYETTISEAGVVTSRKRVQVEEPIKPTKIEVSAKETPPKVEPISEVVKSSEEGLVPPDRPGIPEFGISAKADVIKRVGADKYSATVLENKFGVRIERKDGQNVFRVRGPELPVEGVIAVESQLREYGIEKPWVGKYKPEVRDTEYPEGTVDVIEFDPEAPRPRIVPDLRIVEPKPPKISDRIRTLFEEGKDVPEIAKAVAMSEEATAMALHEMRLSRGKKIVTMEKVEAEANKILKESKDLDEVHKKMQELTTRYEENIDAGFADNFELNRYRDWGDELMGKIVDTRRKAGLVPEPDPEVPISVVTKEGVRESFVDPTDKGGFSTEKVADTYRKLNPEVGEVAENPNAPGQFVFRTRPDVVLDTGGFQKMYEALTDRLKRRAAEKLQPDAREVLDKGKIVKQRKVKGRIYPPVYEAQLEILKGTKKLDQTMFHRGFENPIRTFEDAGGQAMLDLTVHEYHAREFAIKKMQKKFRKDRKEIGRGLKRKERERIMIHAVASEKGGPAKLKLMGITEKDYPKLNSKERVAYDSLRARYEAWYTRLNRVRKAIGKEPFPYTENYFTFIRDLSWLERIEARPLDMPADILNAHFIKMGATPFRFAKPRSNARYRLEMDPFHVLEIYEDSAIRHIQLSPLIAQMRELQLSITDPVSGKPFLLQNENPVLNASLHSWTNHIAGMKSPTFKLPPGVESTMMRINSNLAASILGANARSAMIQVSALRNTVAEIGFEYTTRGVLSLIDPTRRNFAMKKSKVLLQRAYDVTVEDALRGIRAGRIGEVKKVAAKVALKPLQILDLEWAKACWQGGYEYAKGPLKFSETRARIYADDLVTRTQASAMPGDIAPVQRAVAGKFLTLFQTFTINDWNFLVKDVMRIGREGPMSKPAFKNAMRFVAATTLFNMLMEDVLKIQSPFPTPIRAFRESLERGDDIPSLAWNVGKEFIEPIPIIGAARYGKGPFGPGGELLTESVEFIRMDPQAREWWELSGKWLGVPGTAQTGKTVRARERGETPYGQIVGTYTPPEPKMKELRGLETLETMQLGP